jgi:hypothetical protein
MNRWIHALALQARKQVAQAFGMTRKNKPGRLAPGARSRGSYASQVLPGAPTQVCFAA